MVYGSNPGLSILKVISFGFGLLLTEFLAKFSFG